MKALSATRKKLPLGLSETEWREALAFYFKNGASAVALAERLQRSGDAIRNALGSKWVLAEMDRMRHLSAPPEFNRAIASIKEIKAHYTTQMRGEGYAEDIKDLEGEITVALERVLQLEEACRAPEVDAISKLSAMQMVVSTRNSIRQFKIQLKNLKLAQQAEGNKAAKVLAEMLGAFESGKGDGFKSPEEILEAVMIAAVKSTPKGSAAGLVARLGVPIDVESEKV